MASESMFSDVVIHDDYYSAVRWAYARGIISSSEDGLLLPEEKISPEDYAAWLNAFTNYRKLDAIEATILDPEAAVVYEMDAKADVSKVPVIEIVEEKKPVNKPVNKPAAEKKPVETAPEQNKTEAPAEEDSSMPVWLIIVIAVGAAAVIAVIVVIVSKKKKNAKK